jgi:hypothetical protein
MLTLKRISSAIPNAIKKYLKPTGLPPLNIKCSSRDLLPSLMQYANKRKIPFRKPNGIYIYIGASSEAGRNPTALKLS